LSDLARSDRHIVVPSVAEFTEQWHFSHAVRATGLLWLSGVTGTDVRGVVDPDPARQFEQAFVHLADCLDAAGAGMADLVELTSYHVDLRHHLDTFITVKDRHVRAPYPAWSAIGISELITPGALVEIRAVATDPNATP